MPPVHRLRLHLPLPLSSQSITPFYHLRTVHSTPKTHYETLDISPTATASEIKTAFYKLSKLHHPDHNPTDPNASARFVALSTAYSILSRPDSRQTYDREHRIHSHHASHSTQSQSHHRHGGSRPASGLSRRRTQPKGPPPSYYSHGPGSEAWRAGPQGGRGRGEYTGMSEEAMRDAGDLPHYDHEAKRRQHAEYEARWERNKTRKGSGEEASKVDLGDLIKALTVTGMLGITVWGVGLMNDRKVEERKKQAAEKHKK